MWLLLLVSGSLMITSRHLFVNMLGSSVWSVVLGGRRFRRPTSTWVYLYTTLYSIREMLCQNADHTRIDKIRQTVTIFFSKNQA